MQVHSNEVRNQILNIRLIILLVATIESINHLILIKYSIKGSNTGAMWEEALVIRHISM